MSSVFYKILKYWTVIFEVAVLTSLLSFIISAGSVKFNLLNNNFQFKIQKCLTDPGGRFIIADIETEERTLTLVNIYAPNNDDPSFFRVVSEKMSSFECDLIVFGGDFNLVCDIQKDKKGGAPTTHWKSREAVLSFKEKFELADIWRIHNPDIMRFTWKRTNPEIQCRLDYFLISDSLCPNVFEAEILPGYRTDHCMITVRISATTNPRDQASGN